MARTSSLEALPTAVLSEVIARVASSSVQDLCSCKISCKALDRIGKDRYVLKKVGIEELHTSPLFKHWRGREGALGFFQQCLDSDNSEAFFQQGMADYFGEGELEQGVTNLERAAILGHKVAAYVVGLIHLCCGPDDKKHEGMYLINCVKACTGSRIFSVRVRVYDFLESINWQKLGKWHKPNYQRKPISCAREKQHGHGRCPRRCPWMAPAYLTGDTDDILECGACSCEYESEFFRSLFRNTNV